MYRHLLVPLDSGDLAFEVVGRALALARPLGARVTFFHALQDPECVVVEPFELLHLGSPELRDTRRTGRTRELLAKAEAGARALGVPCDARWSRGQPLAAATVAAARALGCDVIFMGSPAHGGVGSATLSVLASAGIPVLVAPALPPTPQERAVGVLRDEHRAIAAVIHACTSLLAAARESGGAADPAVLRAALAALRGKPLGQHHQREERHLFARLRARSPGLAAEFDELERQHARDDALLDELSARLAVLEDAAGVPARIAATRALEQAMARFAELHWEHMGREEAVVLPAARLLLQPEDWAALNAVFAHAPAGPSEAHLEFQQLLARIG